MSKTQQVNVWAVDPGKKGALAFFPARGPKTVEDMPVNDKGVDVRVLSALFDPSPFKPEHFVVVIEDVYSMPRDGHAGAFAFGRSKGVVEGVCAAYGLPVHYVTPSKWKKEMGLAGIARNLAKDAARRKAMDLYPKFVADLSRKKDDGRAEAILIAHWYLHERKK